MELEKEGLDYPRFMFVERLKDEEDLEDLIQKMEEGYQYRFQIPYKKDVLTVFEFDAAELYQKKEFLTSIMEAFEQELQSKGDS